MKDLVIEALYNEGYEVFDGRFVELGAYGILTIAWDNDADIDKIQIAEGDWYQYYWNNYDNCMVIGENSDLDDMFDYLDNELLKNCEETLDD